MEGCSGCLSFRSFQLEWSKSKHFQFWDEKKKKERNWTDFFSFWKKNQQLGFLFFWSSMSLTVFLSFYLFPSLSLSLPLSFSLYLSIYLPSTLSFFNLSSSRPHRLMFSVSLILFQCLTQCLFHCTNLLLFWVSMTTVRAFSALPFWARNRPLCVTAPIKVAQTFFFLLKKLSVGVGRTQWSDKRNTETEKKLKREKKNSFLFF